MEISLVKGEIKVLTFTFNTDIATATFTLICKDSKGKAKFTKADDDFDKTDIANKIVKVTIDTSTLSIGDYYMQLKTAWSETSIDISEKYTLKITESLHN